VRRRRLVPVYRLDRAWVATVTRPGERSLTTTVYGPTAREAEIRAESDRGPGARVVVRLELPPR
jgi:hypothetical protein